MNIYFCAQNLVISGYKKYVNHLTSKLFTKFDTYTK
ncbi:hypothetical protein CH70_1894 [Francisella tularensis subsp. novicida]|nr:hypothetical protein AS84_517 [Francisella tularensis subsp. novicida F6168]AJJ47520.1 hypothetical protein CH70_1894 [Francisella tularensis subsp. novicida]APC99339.1 hypothetical protein KX03_181 [Francisella tularensis subsp. novicida]